MFVLNGPDKEVRKQMNLLVDGIVCAGCAMDMETVFRNTDGITKTVVDYAKATVQIEYAPDEITEAQILSQIQRMGIIVIKNG